MDVPPDDDEALKLLNPVKSGKLSIGLSLMETSKLDNQQKGILKCAPKNNFWTISCAIKRKDSKLFWWGCTIGMAEGFF